MPLADGDSAEPWNVWTRVITDNNYWKTNGTLHNKAFSKGAFVAPEEAKRRPWSQELSGRLLSVINDLEKESVDFCTARGREFGGIMFQTAENLKSEGSGFPTDVIYTPNADIAHTDFVAFNTTDDFLFELRDWLQDFIQHVKPDKLAAVESLRSNFP